MKKTTHECSSILSSHGSPTYYLLSEVLDPLNPKCINDQVDSSLSPLYIPLHTLPRSGVESNRVNPGSASKPSCLESGERSCRPAPSRNYVRGWKCMTNENYTHYGGCQILIGCVMLMATSRGAAIRQCESHAHLSIV